MDVAGPPTPDLRDGGATAGFVAAGFPGDFAAGVAGSVLLDDLTGSGDRDSVAAALAVELADLETRRYSDPQGISERAGRVLDVARSYELSHENGRARLILADVVGRSDNVESAVETARVILFQAHAAGDLTVAARAEAVLAWCLFRMGALGEALAHAVDAVRILPDSAPEHLRVDHAMIRALLSAMQKSDTAYIAMFDRVVADAERLGNAHLLLSTLNNYAWSLYHRGVAAQATPLIARIDAVSREAGIPLNSTVLDTVASVLLETGDLPGAEEVARSVLRPGVAEAEVRAVPEALLTLAKIRARRGAPAEALALVVQAERIASERALPEIVAMVTEDKALLLAEQGDFRGAYEALSVSFSTWKHVRDRDADARASSLNMLFETEQARQRSQLFEELAERDALTGMWNRRHLDRLLPLLLADAERQRLPLSLAIMDADNFKQLNDARSHLTGDAVLARLGTLLNKVIAEPGFTARLGGEEFVLVMPGLAAEAAHTTCESARQLIGDQPWLLITDGLDVTVSIGFATASPGGTVSDLLGKADEALYRAKNAGRNRVHPAVF